MRYRGEAQYKLPRLFLLAIGVSDYQNKQYRLRFAHTDAEDLSKGFQSQKGKMWREVQVKTLTNREATRANVVDLWTSSFGKQHRKTS